MYSVLPKQSPANNAPAIGNTVEHHVKASFLPGPLYGKGKPFNFEIPPNHAPGAPLDHGQPAR
jgi:hypothetical protein